MFDENYVKSLQDRVQSLEVRLASIQSGVKVGIGVASISAVAVLAIYGLTSWMQVPKAVQHHVEARVPSMVDEKVNKDLPDLVKQKVEDKVQTEIFDIQPKMQDLRTRLENIDAEISQAETMIKELQVSDQILTRITYLEDNFSTLPVSRIGDSQCEWINVGYDKTHENLGPWCPDGHFITQLDFDAHEHRPKGSSPIVGKALCCTP